MNSTIIQKLETLSREIGKICPTSQGEIENVIRGIERTNLEATGAVKIINARLNILACQHFNQSKDQATMDRIRSYLAPISRPEHFNDWYLDIRDGFIPGFKSALGR